LIFQERNKMRAEKIEAIYPLSPLQQGMLFHTLYSPGQGLYVEQLYCTLRGKLDVAAFMQAWQQVVERHPILRTSFHWEDLKQPLQSVHRRVTLPFEQYDWRGVSCDEQRARQEAILEQARSAGFVLSSAPLMRLALAQLDEDTYRLIWSFHHVLLDGWSTPLLLNEVFAFYESFRHGRQLVLEQPRPYREYIAWLQRQNTAKAEAFWRRQLYGFTTPTMLPIDPVSERLPAEHADAAEIDVLLDAPTTAGLHSLARQHRLTLNILFQGAWALLLNRYSSEEDILFGATVSGRPAALRGVEAMIGLFINTLPIRVRVASDAFLLNWLKELQAEQIERHQYEYSSLIQIQGWSAVPRGTPLFESLVIFENYPVGRVEQDVDTALAVVDVHTLERTNYPLTVVAVPGSQMLLRISYDRRRFEAATIRRMLGHLETLLMGMVATPERRLAELPLLTAAELQQQLVTWNTTAATYPRTRCIHQLFVAQVQRTPDALAITFNDQQLSYAALNQRTEQLAQHLQARGVGPDVLVGICLERSLDLVVALLAVLKAGGAYIPIDPHAPAERLAFMLEDSRAALLITNSIYDLRFTIEDLKHPNNVIVNRKSKIVNVDNLAYIIYTSGSTGTPKGVMVSHRAVVNLLCSMRDQLGITHEDRLLAVTTISFDIAVLELFLPLTVGAQIVLVSRAIAADGWLLSATLRYFRATAMQATPATWRLLLEAGWPGDGQLNALCGGEALPRDLATQLLPRSAALWNLYGPTETTIWSAIARITADTGVVIGRPIANTQIYLLDQRLNPLPIGVPGEIYIGGTGLARGYLNRSELTAERFVPNPFATLTPAAAAAPPLPRTGEGAGGEGARLYCTGDLARYRPDGTIEFLGRIDHQIKLHGYRIEPAEIEATLGQHPAVRACVVVLACEDTPGEKRLVAYVVPAETLNDERRTINGPEWSSSAFSVQRSALGVELRAFLQQRLPRYMLPSAFVLLAALPLTTSGKLDRKALPMPERADLALVHSYVAPRTALEKTLAAIWAEVLGLPRIGVYDNFFELGGHSLIATQVVSRVRDALKQEISLQLLFESETIAALAEAIADTDQERAALATPLRPVARAGDLPLSFAQERLWFLEQLYPNNTAYNMPIAVRLTGRLRLLALQVSFNALVQRHEVLRTTFVAAADQPRQVIAPTLCLPLTLLDLQGLIPTLQARTATWLMQSAARSPFELARGPLIRVALLRLSPQTHLLLLTLHHSIADGWSIPLLLRDLSILYAQHLGEAAVLPELPIQYADYAVWQRAWLQGDVRAQQLAYWQTQLAGAPTVLALPTDYPRPPVEQGRGMPQRLVIPEDVVAGLRALSRQSGATLFMTLLAGWLSLLQRYSGQDDLLVGVPIAGRTHREVEDLIGCFVNTLVLRGDLRGNPRVREVLARIRETSLAAYAHQDLPFELLVEALQPMRDLRRQPLCQVLCTLQNTPSAAVTVPDLTLEQLELEDQTAKFDLTLSLNEDLENRVTGVLQYSTDLFNASTITRLTSHFVTILAGMTTDPERRLSDLQLLTAAERSQILVEWNDTIAGVGGRDGSRTVCTGVRSRASDTRCIHHLIVAQAARTPDAVALVFDETKDEGRRTKEESAPVVPRPSSFVVQLTYAELDRRANQLAQHLRVLGVGPEVPVGICLDRSIELVVALLGVLKAGGAYVPLDPSYPAERLAFMLDDADVRVLITNSIDDLRFTIDDLGESGAPIVNRKSKIVNLDTDWPTLAAYPTSPPAQPASPANLAYVIYTSGSTGQPKGAMIAHRAIVNRLRWMQDTYQLTAADAVLQKTPFSFDVSVWEFFWPLISGARLVLAQPGGHKDAAYLVGLIARSQITTLHFVPPMLRVFLEEPDLKNCTSIRRVICSGEALPYDLQEHFFAQLDAELHNLYGPTEAAIDVTAWVCQRGGARQTVPIGRPIANTQIYLLDAQLDPVPIGVSGELYIGGVQLARGYFARPDLTAERFIPNPFAEVSGSGYGVLGAEVSDIRHPTPDPRLYRTGDQARYAPDGSIEYLGRLDDQIKIHGYRIELGEIEAILAQHHAVRAVAVVLWEQRPGDQRLLAYVVPAETLNDERRTMNGPEWSSSAFSVQRSALVAELRTFLQERLPSYMIPAQIIVLEALPLTVNGKLDRRALPAPETTNLAQGGTYIAPRTATEIAIAQLWADLLHMERVSIRDNFFELGGNSILVVRLMAQIRTQFGQDLPVATLFQGPTIEHLAHQLQTQPDRKPTSPLVGLQTRGSKQPFYCVHPDSGGVNCYVHLARLLGSDRPFYGFQAPSLYEDKEPYTSVEAMASHYVATLRSAQPEGPYLLGGWSFGGVVAFEMARQLHQQEQHVSFLALLDSRVSAAESTLVDEDDASTIARLVQGLEARFERKLPLSVEALRRLDTREQLNYLIDIMQTADLIPLDVGLAEALRILRTFKAHLSALQRYRPSVYPNKITLFRVNEASNGFLADVTADPTRGWGAFSAQPVDVCTVPGTHYQMIFEPHVQALAAHLKAYIDDTCEAV